VPFTVGGDPGRVGGFDLESACAVAGSDEHRVPLRMPGRSGPANGRESTADENVPVPGQPLVESSLLHELPSSSSDWTARQPPRSPQSKRL
jgi:hypothetical protein